jgi:hypothetical protein
VSVSMYRGQVDRLTTELAALEKRVADERTGAARERSNALRIGSSIRASNTPSSVQSKLRQVQRLEEKAVAHDKRAAQHSDQVASKRRALTKAQASLEQALEQVRRQEDREVKKKRDIELRHVREIERLRRQKSQPFPETLAARQFSVAPSDSSAVPGEYEYDVCLSFAGENRDYVEMVARELSAQGVRVFYDEDAKITLWGKDLLEHFDRIYRKASRYCVMFISEHYARKPWARHERRSALARALEEEGEYILPARFDSTDLSGLPPTIAYLDLTEIAPATLVSHIMEKLRPGRT